MQVNITWYQCNLLPFPPLLSSWSYLQLKEREEGSEKLKKDISNLEQQLRESQTEKHKSEMVIDSLTEELKRVQSDFRSTKEKLGMTEDGLETIKARLNEKQQEVWSSILRRHVAYKSRKMKSFVGSDTLII